MRKFFLFLGLILCVFSFLRASNISGYVTADKTGEPLSYANIILVETDYGAATSVHGYYVMTGIPPGSYILRVMMMGYATEEMPVRLNPDEDLRIDLSLDVSVIQGETVTVTAERTRFENKVDVSRLNLNLREIKSAPAFIESDVFRSLQLLPGITSQNDFSAALIVRGGSPDENLILLDGCEVYNPYHIGGIFSTFNADAIADAEFTAGGFTPEFGGRLSSVLEINTREGDSKNGRFFKNTALGPYFDISHIKGEVNILSSKILLEGPLYKGSWLFSARRTYFDVLAGLYYRIKNDPQNWQYYFGDLQLKITQKINDTHHLTYNSFGGHDVLAFILEPGSANEINFDWDWGNRTNSLNWRCVPNAMVYNEFTLSRTDYLFDVDLSFMQMDSAGRKAETRIMVNNGVYDLTLQDNLTLFAGPSHQIKTGISLKFLEMDLDFNLDGASLIRIGNKPYIFETYLQDQWKINVRLTLQGGIRLSKYELHDRLYFQPRFGFKYNLTENCKLKFSTGWYHQFIFTTNDDNEILRVVDFWEPVPADLPAQESLHTIVGLEQWLGEGFTFSVEGYYKAYPSVLDGNPNNDPSDETDDFIAGSGYAYGSEILLKRERGKLTGWIGYAYSRVYKHIDLNQDGDITRQDSEKFPLKYDTPHRVNVLLNYRLNDKSNLSFTYVFQNGQRYTPVVAKVFHRSGFTDLLNPYGNLSTISGETNAAAFPNYIRADLGYTRDVNFWGINGTLKIQIINISNHFNILLYNWDHSESPSRVTALGMFPFIPSVGLEFEL